MSNNSQSDIPSLRDECKIIMTPTFYKDFQCIGPECENTCCQRWNISIDPVTYKNLIQLGDPKVTEVLAINTRPSTSVQTNNASPHQSAQHKDFVLNEKGQCPLFTEEGLCYLHGNYGEQYLPMICQIYPRDDKLIDGTVYNSLSLSCPEAARKILLNPAAMQVKEKAVKKNTKISAFAVKALLKDVPLHEQFKQLLYQCVIGSETDTLEQRLFKMAVVFDVVNMRIKNNGDVQSALYTLEHSLLSGKMDEMYDQTPVTEDIQHQVLQQLLVEKRFVMTNQVFSEYKAKAFEKLLNSDAFDLESKSIDMGNFHHKLCDKGYQKLIDSHGHAFLNLLLHWIYSRLFNLHGGSDLYMEFAHLALKFQLIRALCGILHEDEFDEEENGKLLVGVIHSISRTSDHDQQLISEIYQKLCQDDLGQHEHILGLIKV